MNRATKISRTYKARILVDLVRGKTGLLQTMYNNRERNPENMTDAQLITEIERGRKKIFQETGIMPPPYRHPETMTDEELNIRIAALKQKL